MEHTSSRNLLATAKLNMSVTYFATRFVNFRMTNKLECETETIFEFGNLRQCYVGFSKGNFGIDWRFGGRDQK